MCDHFQQISHIVKLFRTPALRGVFGRGVGDVTHTHLYRGCVLVSRDCELFFSCDNRSLLMLGGFRQVIPPPPTLTPLLL